MAELLALNGITKTFAPGTVHEKKAIEDLSVTLAKGDFVTIIGSNGAGKSTLFGAIAGSFYPDAGRILLEGKDITLISSGVLLTQCLEAAEVLKEKGVEARVLNMHTIKPVDREAVEKAARETGRIVTVENHNIIGGLGSAVAELLAENHPVPILRVGVCDCFGQTGTVDFLRKEYHLQPEDIAEKVRKVIMLKKER